MNTYRLPTTGQETSIKGTNLIDAIKHNLKTIATTKRMNRETRKIETTIHPHKEVYAQWSASILGGAGGVEIIMRDDTETFTAWLECDRAEWIEAVNGKKTIQIK
jgi:hypothetical protein